MKRIFAAVVGVGLLIGSAIVAIAANTIGASPAVPSFGDVSTSPVVVCGAFDYNGGPQITTVNVCGGTFQANSGSAVTVANPYVTANSVILFGLKTAGGTPAAPFMVTVTPGTGFTVNSGNSDTSTYNYWIFG